MFDGGGTMIRQFFPEPDCITIEEYHRLSPARPAPPTRPALAGPTLTCPACSKTFVPHVFAGRPRFCSRGCRRWFHSRAQAAQRKAAVS